ncbi:MAG: hypothetical protein M3Q15_06065 [Pseudomonadota bacterium]|nr:hypothetical protein [Pseudomonadota bacterium]
MNEPKSFAALSSGLLARKGTARPAMRPQGFGQFGAGMEDLGWNDMGHAAPPRTEENERDHSPSPIAALTPMGGEPVPEQRYQAPMVVEQQRAAIVASFGDDGEDRAVLSTKAKKPAVEAVEIEEQAQLEEPAVCFDADVDAFDPPETEQAVLPEPAIAPVAVDAGKAKAAFTLRLDSQRHLKLRLACAVSGRSAQQLVTEALDQLIQSRPDVSALAEQVPPKSGKRG